MKEDKENTKPKRGEHRAGGEEEGEKLERVKEKREILSKVVIRRLPPSLTKEQLEEHLQPLPDHDYFEFFASDSSLFPHLFSRAYINFKSQEDIVLFRDRFDGYVFIDHRDPEYKKFLESYSVDDEKLTSTPETLLEEIEARNKEMIAKKTTPLLSFLKNRQRLRDEKREERRRRELERKRQREEERRKWKEDERRKRKETEKQKKFERAPEREPDRSKDEPKIKLLKKPENERDPEKKFKPRKLEKENLREERGSTGKRSDGEIGEEKLKKSEEEYVKDYRDKDYDRERERRLREKEKLRRHEDDRRKPRDRFEKDRCFRRREDDYRKDRETARERARKQELVECPQNTDKAERVAKDDRKDDAAKRDRIRNKDRPAMQLYQPGARSKTRTMPGDEDIAKSPDQTTDKKPESETDTREEE
ncbi:regulator of nonsense transcripts 3B isoform X2 [Ascaphus truei]|uniref:regulator of nonsense transcripts 3B isoform X2 n=1 Tax=Ascaphus truei TaxID=8439 RepID=UPI003F59B319